jgi:hypothetical protein
MSVLLDAPGANPTHKAFIEVYSGRFRAECLVDLPESAKVARTRDRKDSTMAKNTVWSIGFKEETGYHVNREPLDGDPRQIEYVDTTLDKGTNPTFEPGRLYAGRKVKPDHVPTKAVWGNKKVKPYDVFVLQGLILVSDTVKDIVEHFEPGIHQFYPIEMVYKDGSHARQMYFFNICARLDTMDRKRATAELINNVLWDPATGRFIFSNTLIGNRHAWIDKHVSPGLFILQ